MKNPVLQGITTKYIGPTNTKGARISVRSQGRSMLAHYDHALNIEDNHRVAAEILAAKMDWLDGYELMQGGSPDGSGYLFVLVPHELLVL